MAVLRSSGQLAFRIAVVAVAYGLLGVVSYPLGVPEGYPTIGWPPAGIAMAATILWGPWVLPGVWLGSVCTNYFNDAPLGTSAALAVGAALEAAAGRWLTRRFAKSAN